MPNLDQHDADRWLMAGLAVAVSAGLWLTLSTGFVTLYHWYVPSGDVPALGHDSLLATVAIVVAWLAGMPATAVFLGRRWRGSPWALVLGVALILAVWTPALALSLSFTNQCALGRSFPLPGMAC